MSVFGHGLEHVRTVGDLKKALGGEKYPTGMFWFEIGEPGIGPSIFCGSPSFQDEWPPMKKHCRGDLHKFLCQYSDDLPCEIVRRHSDGEVVVRVNLSPPGEPGPPGVEGEKGEKP